MPPSYFCASESTPPLSLNNYLSALQKPSGRFLRHFGSFLVFGGSLTPLLFDLQRLWLEQIRNRVSRSCPKAVWSFSATVLYLSPLLHGRRLGCLRTLQPFVQSPGKIRTWEMYVSCLILVISRTWGHLFPCAQFRVFAPTILFPPLSITYQTKLSVTYSFFFAAIFMQTTQPIGSLLFTYATDGAMSPCHALHFGPISTGQ